MLYDCVYKLKNNKKNISVLVIPRNYEYLNGVAECCFFVDLNKYKYIIAVNT